MANYPNILLSGKMGAGKTALATMLKGQLGYVPVSLASSLKEEAVRLIGRPIDKKTDRRFLQLFGQACRDGISKDYWCERLYMKTLETVAPFVVDDVRFENEVSFFKARLTNTITVRLNVNTEVRLRRLYERDGNYEDIIKLEQDESENGFPPNFKFDIVLNLKDTDSIIDVYNMLAFRLQEVVTRAIH